MYFKTWNESSPKITDDDNFYISRVRPAERFVNTATQVNTTMTQDRKLCWWCPSGISDTQWGALPRYTFDADAFSMWQYLDYHGNWSDGWIRVPGAFSDAAHKNGVMNGCVLFFDNSVTSTSETGQTINLLTEKDGNGNFTNARKLIRFMKYYGIDGLGVNPEGSLQSSMVPLLKEFFEQCHKIALEEKWHFNVYWYESMSNSGYVYYSNELTTGNNEWFQRSGQQYPVSDMFMLNYNWSGKLASSASVAKNLGRSPYGVFSSFDIQGRWLRQSDGNGWNEIYNNPVSIAIWGAHAKNMIYENSNEFGSDDYTLQTTYQKKQEQFFTGGTRNPANSPAITNSVASASWNSMTSFHGISKYISARSAINKIPFVTRFCTGNGRFLNYNGTTTFSGKWYNLGMQDILPTWRWWIVDDNGKVPADAVNCEFNFDDAWFGGSVLKISGATSKSNIRMFKTDFNLTADNNISVRYKVLGGIDAHMNLIWTPDGNTWYSYPMQESKKANEWTETSVDAATAGMTGKVEEIGFSIENTSSDFAIELGELSITDNHVYTPIKPTITSSQVLSGTYNTVSFKLIYKSKDPDSTKPYEPIYNDDVDTWYFEIYSQVKGGEPVLCTTTTSWATYVVGAPAAESANENDQTGNENRFGVCAVAPDGKTRSEIAWTDYSTRPIVTSEDIEVNKAVIKPNETFIVKYSDPSHEPAYLWRVYNAATGRQVGKSKTNSVADTLSISDCGTYDVGIMPKRGSTETKHRGMIQISPESTGAIPIIDQLTVDKATAKINESITANVTISRLGEGKVSRGLAVRDPEMLRLPEDIGATDNFSLAFWFKPEKWAPGKYGTNLINKRDFTGNWPHNNWGDFWVHIWPETPVYSDCAPNVISFTQWQQGQTLSGYTDPQGPGGEDGNIHESPNRHCWGNDYSISLNNWTHIVITIGNGKQSLWINGRKVAEETIKWAGNNPYLSGGSGAHYVYIGGTNVYHGGLIGIVDEVQYWKGRVLDATGVADAMAGYEGRTIPDDLYGYWNFENSPIQLNGNTKKSSFTNLGKGGTDFYATMIKFQGAGGENTSGTVAVPVDANNNELGNPAITGSLDVNTSTVWDVPTATSTIPSGTQNVIQFGSNGEKTISANVVNRWGKDTRNAIVVINDANAINSTKENKIAATVYPNPFVKNLNIDFATNGNYVIEIDAADGRMVTRKIFSTAANATVQLNVDGAAGIYFVRITKDGKYVGSTKIIKK
jgi:endo-beta-N-acetylglucosaminidase D